MTINKNDEVSSAPMTTDNDLNNVDDVKKTMSNVSRVTSSTESGQYSTGGDNDEPWDIKKMEDPDPAPDDEMNPSFNDTNGCNVLGPLYNFQNVCSIRARTVSPVRRTDEFVDMDDNGLDDGDLPTLSVKKRFSDPIQPTQNYDTISVASSTNSIQLQAPKMTPLEMRKAKSFWSQLEVDLDDENESHGSIDSLSRERKKSKSSKKRRSRREQKKRAPPPPEKKKKTKPAQSNILNDGLTSFCGLAQEVSDGFKETFCGKSEPIICNQTIYPGYYAIDTSDYEQTAIEVEYMPDGVSDGSFDELDEIDDPVTAAGSFLQLGTDGTMMRVKPRARSPARVVITNMPSEIDRSPSPEPREEILSSKDDGASVTSNVSKQSRNSILGSISRMSKKKFFAKKKHEENESSDIDPEPKVNMSNWSEAKKKKYKDLMRKGYNEEDCGIIIEEIEDATLGKFEEYESQDESYMEGDTSVSASASASASVSASASHLKSKRKLWPRKNSQGDTGSVSSASTIGDKGKKMLNYFRERSRRKKDKVAQPKAQNTLADVGFTQYKMTNNGKPSIEIENNPSMRSSSSNIAKSQSPSPPPPPPPSPPPRASPPPPPPPPPPPQVEQRSKSRNSTSPSQRDAFLNQFKTRSRNRPRSVDAMSRANNRSTTVDQNEERRNKSAPRGGRVSPLSTRARPIPGIDDLLKTSFSFDIPQREKEDRTEIQPSPSLQKWGSIHSSDEDDDISNRFNDYAQTIKSENVTSHTTSLLHKNDPNNSKNDNKIYKTNSNLSEKNIPNVLLQVPQNVRKNLVRKKSWSKLNEIETMSGSSNDSVFDGLSIDSSKDNKEEQSDPNIAQNEQEKPYSTRVKTLDELLDSVPQIPLISPSFSNLPKYSSMNEGNLKGEPDSPRGRTELQAEDLGTKERNKRSTSTSRGAELRRRRLSMQDANSKTKKIDQELQSDKETNVFHTETNMKSRLDDITDEMEYVPVSVDEESLGSYGSKSTNISSHDQKSLDLIKENQSNEETGHDEAPNMEIQDGNQLMTSQEMSNHTSEDLEVEQNVENEVDHEIPQNILQQNDIRESSSKVSDINGGAASRRLERARKANPWLNNVQKDTTKQIETISDSTLYPSDVKDTVPFDNFFKNEEDSASEKKVVTLDSFLEKTRMLSSEPIERDSRSVASTLGARSIMTTSTDATWKRRNGTSRDKRRKAEQAKALKPNTGWLESIKSAATNGSVAHHTWDAELGWVPIPGFEGGAVDIKNDTSSEIYAQSDPILDLSESRSESSEDNFIDSQHAEKVSTTPILSKKKVKSDEKNEYMAFETPKLQSRNKHNSSMLGISNQNLLKPQFPQEKEKNVIPTKTSLTIKPQDSANFIPEISNLTSKGTKLHTNTVEGQKQSIEEKDQFADDPDYGKGFDIDNQNQKVFTKNKGVKTETLIKLESNPKDLKKSTKQMKSDDISKYGKKPNKSNLSSAGKAKSLKDDIITLENSIHTRDDSHENDDDDLNSNTKITFHAFFEKSTDEFSPVIKKEKSSSTSNEQRKIVNTAETAIVKVVKEKISDEDNQLFQLNQQNWFEISKSSTHDEDDKMTVNTKDEENSFPSELFKDDEEEEGTQSTSTKSLNPRKLFESKSESNPENLSNKDNENKNEPTSGVNEEERLNPSLILKAKMRELKSTLNLSLSSEKDKEEVEKTEETRKRAAAMKSDIKNARIIKEMSRKANLDKVKGKGDSRNSKKLSDNNADENYEQRNEKKKMKEVDKIKQDKKIKRDDSKKKSNEMEDKNIESKIKQMPSVESSSTGFTSFLRRYDAEAKETNKKKSRKRSSLKRIANREESDVSEEEDSLFLDSLARTLTEDEDDAGTRQSKQNEERKNIPSIPERVAFNEGAVFKEAQQSQEIDLSSNHVSILSSVKERLEMHNNSRVSRASYSSAASTGRSKWEEVYSDTGANDCAGGFFSRLKACNVSHGIGEDCKNDELPLAHLAFLRSSGTDTKNNCKEEESISMPTSPPTPEVLFKSIEVKPSTDSSLTFRTFGENNLPQKNEKKSSIHTDTSKSVASHKEYLEKVARRAAQSSFHNSRVNKNKDNDTESHISHKSNTSEAWQAFLAKKNLKEKLRSSSRPHGSEATSAAERFALNKVDEMIEAMANSGSEIRKKKAAHDIIDSISNTGSSVLSPLDADRFLAERERKAILRATSRPKSRSNSGSRSQSVVRSQSRPKPRPEYAEAAEKIAAARVEAMMSVMTNESIEEGI